jgi:hypothetical protein
MRASPWTTVHDYLRRFSSLYPGIGMWSAKTLREVPTGRRSILAFLAADGTLDGLAITKNGLDAKLCHISISDRAREDGRGLSLMRAAALEMLNNGARRIHVTTSEEVAAEFGPFFERCGFSHVSARAGRYRRGADELEWESSRELLSARLFPRVRHPLDETYRHVPMQLEWRANSYSFDWTRFARGHRITHGGEHQLTPASHFEARVA